MITKIFARVVKNETIDEKWSEYQKSLNAGKINKEMFKAMKMAYADGANDMVKRLDDHNAFKKQ